jgi:hypothetical protein
MSDKKNAKEHRKRLTDFCVENEIEFKKNTPTKVLQKRVDEWMEGNRESEEETGEASAEAAEKTLEDLDSEMDESSEEEGKEDFTTGGVREIGGVEGKNLPPEFTKANPKEIGGVKEGAAPEPVVPVSVVKKDRSSQQNHSRPIPEKAGKNFLGYCVNTGEALYSDK